MRFYPRAQRPKFADHNGRRHSSCFTIISVVVGISTTLAPNNVVVGDEIECRYAASRYFVASRPFDATDGADPRHYPREFPVDFKHLRLQLTFADLTSKSFDGVAALTMRAVRDDVTVLKLDAVDLDIDRVTDEAGQDIRFDHDARELTLYFDLPLPTGSDTVATIHYRCVDPLEGMYFALPDESYADRPLVVHTQGETDTSRYWFPCLDDPGDRLTTELIVTVPAPYFALSNGRLIKATDDDTNWPQRMTTYHWRQNVPHVFYLVSLVIGEFDEVKDMWRDVPVSYYVPKGRAADAKRTYQNTPRIMEYFSQLLGVDYPFEKYAQVNVPMFNYGGMENTSATTITDRALLDERAAIDNDHEGLISHELAHQWFGDLITCRSWPHVWLNEGFATFMASLWREKYFGREDYLNEFWQRFQSVAAADDTTTPGAVVLADYSFSFEPFFHKGALAYSKGSCVLHMLRHQLGDELFWKAMQVYTRRFRETQVETADLRRVFEEVTGRSLERFFQQWLYRPGVPHITVEYTWHAEHKVAEVSIKQTQHIAEKTPAFAFPLDLYFRAGGEVVTTTIDITSRTDGYRRRFETAPDLFCVDPYAGLLMKLTCEKPLTMWLTQLAQGPTLVSKMVATRNLADKNRPEVIAALAKTLDDSALHWSLRSEAAKALGTMNTTDAMHALVRSLTTGERTTEPQAPATGSPLPYFAGITDPRTRLAAVQALTRYDRPEAANVLLRFADADPSYSVEAAATSGLGRMHCCNVLSTLQANVHKNSYFNKIREAALNALAELDAREGIPLAKRYAAYGHHDRLRPVAIRALGRLGHREDDRDDVRDFLTALLTDPQDRTVEAAVEALGDLGDAKSRSAIKKRLAGFAKPQLRRTAKQVLKRMTDPKSEHPSVTNIRTSIDDMRDTIEKLEKRLERIEERVPSEKPNDP